MPSWSEVYEEIGNSPGPLESVRKKYLGIMHQYTGRNVITYYSAFLQKRATQQFGIDNNNKNAFIQAVYGPDKSKGLDLILHTPGGSIAATESIVFYLKKIFGRDIRAFVPQIAMSAGTMIALATKEIIMGKQSNLGPIDPQFNGVSCAGIVEEFDTAVDDITRNPAYKAVDCVLTLHHAYMQTLANSNAVKIVENHMSDGVVVTVQRKSR